MADTTNFLKRFRAARGASTPLISVETTDPIATAQKLVTAANGKVAVAVWDCVDGLRGANEAGVAMVHAMGDPDDMISPVGMMNAARMANPPVANSLFIMHNAQDQLDKATVRQAVQNLRTPFKSTGRTLVMFQPVNTLPLSLRHDVVTLSDDLPTEAELAELIGRVYESGRAASDSIVEPTPDDVAQYADALRAMSAFEAEQVAYMSLTRTGLDRGALWERKATQISQIKGLTYVKPTTTTADIGGLDNAKEYMEQRMGGRERVRLFVFIDEIDKAMAATGHDAHVGDSGVGMDIKGTLLTTMEENRHGGQLLLGPPGCSKSFFVKCLSGTYNVPTIMLDLNGLKGGIVGESEANVREAMRTITTLAGGPGGAMFFATCNRLEAITIDLRRRFFDGIWFYDLPGPEEKASIWSIQLAAYGIEDADRPDDTDWSGADIRNCTATAWRNRISLKKAARWVVPAAKSDPAFVKRLREEANGRFLSANRTADTDGIYRLATATTAPSVPSAEGPRQVSFD